MDLQKGIKTMVHFIWPVMTESLLLLPRAFNIVKTKYSLKTKCWITFSPPSPRCKGCIFVIVVKIDQVQYYTCCSHSGSEDDPDQNNFQKNFTKI